MKPVLWRGVWLPADEHHLPEHMARTGEEREGLPTYQLQKYRHAMRHVRKRRLTAIDIGAHAGLWSRNMAIDFAAVVAFEPVPDYCVCWRKNMAGRPHATLHKVALGAVKGRVSLTAKDGISVDTFVGGEGDECERVVASDRPLHRLDDYHVQDVDLIKIDCEGYEALILKGAQGTIQQWKPTVIVEQKPGKAQRYGLGETDAVTMLRSWGAELRDEMAGDFILSWG